VRSAVEKSPESDKSVVNGAMPSKAGCTTFLDWFTTASAATSSLADAQLADFGCCETNIWACSGIERLVIRPMGTTLYSA
jgi:hypothetical protein